MVVLVVVVVEEIVVVVVEVAMALAAVVEVVVKVVERWWMLFKIFNLKFINILNCFLGFYIRNIPAFTNIFSSNISERFC